VCLRTGEPVAFGALGAPRVDVGTAVRCSSAVPGVRAPVMVGGERYVDGGVASLVHLDLVLTHGSANPIHDAHAEVSPGSDGKVKVAAASAGFDVNHGDPISGAKASANHVDLAPYRVPYRVIVSSPMSRFAPLRLLLRAEVRRLERRGIEVMVIEPDARVAKAMGWNPLDLRRAPTVVEPAYRATRDVLAKVSS
jgi:predicted acylesterase/phospholipase RssA